jgi:hypothetical protein
MTNPAQKKRQLPSLHVPKARRPMGDMGSAGRAIAQAANPGPGVVDRVGPEPFPPYDSPDARAKDGPRAQAARYAARGDGTYGLSAGPPGAGLEHIPPVHLPGGAAYTESLQHPAFRTVERLYRKLPEEAMFGNVTPSRPYSFELGAYKVPQTMQLWLTDYEFRVLRLSGADPGDFVYAEAGRFSGQIGFDVRVSQKRPGDLSYELDPAPIPNIGQEFRQPQAQSVRRFPSSAETFDEAAVNSFGSTAGQGNSLLPVRTNVQGPRSGPFTMIVQEGENVALICTVFRPIQTPIAAIEGRLAGFQLAQNLAVTLLNRVNPR